MLTLLLFLLIMSSASFYFCIRYQRSWEEILPCTNGSIVLILFVGGLAGLLKESVYLILAAAALLYIAGLGLLIRERMQSGNMHRLFKTAGLFFTPGFFYFVLLYGLLAFLHRGRLACRWDEFSHWMSVVSTMVKLDALGTSPQSTMLFKDYLPGMALFQYFCEKLNMLLHSDAAFREWTAFFSYQVLAVSFLMPFWKGLSFRKAIPHGILFTLILLSVTVFYNDAVYSIYIDQFVAILAGCGLAQLYLLDRKNRVGLAGLFLTMAMLTLAKDVGIYYSIVLFVLLIVTELSDHAQLKAPRSWRRLAAICLFGALFAFLPKLLWSFHLHRCGIVKHFPAKVDLANLIQVIQGRDQSYRATAFTAFFKRLLSGTMPLGSTAIPVTYPALLVALSVSLLGLNRLYAASNEPAARIPGRRNLIAVSAILATLLYCFGMLLLYLYKFSEVESVALASFDRYIGICFFALSLMIEILALRAFDEEKTHARMAAAVLAVVLALSISYSDLYSMLSRRSVAMAIEARAPYDEISSRAMSVLGKEQKRVFIVTQERQGQEYFILRFTLIPHRTNEQDCFSISPLGAIYEGDIFSGTLSMDQLQERLKEYDLMMVYIADDLFRDSYGELFSCPAEEIVDRTLFTIDRETGTMHKLDQITG